MPSHRRDLRQGTPAEGRGLVGAAGRSVGGRGVPGQPAAGSRWLSGAGIAWSVLVVALDTATGRHAMLIGLLGIGPCCAALAGT